MKISKDEAEMLNSFIKAIESVGGSSRPFISRIDTMTVSELITALAPNRVRFTYTKQKEEDQDDRG